MIRPRSNLRRGEPSKQEKQEARIACHDRAGGICEDCGRWLPLELGHLHHKHSKRRFGWLESNNQRHIWLCARCHHDRHCPKVVPSK